MLTSSAAVVQSVAPLPQFVTTGQVARRLCLDRTTVWRLCVDGKIPATQVADGCEWRIPRWWLDEQLAKTRPVRR